MKCLQLLTVFLMFSALSFGQNQSNGPVPITITNPIGPQFGGQEIFRFRPGVVTQLQSGTSFDFNSSQWFSIGNLDTSLLPSPLTGTNEVFGLRFQLPRKSLVMGYQDIGDINPRIQWLGLGPGEFLGDLEFRVADNFTTTNSDLVATMRNDSGTVFGLSSTSDFDDSKVGILDFQFDKALNIIQELGSANPTYSIDVFNNSSSPENYGVNARVRGSAGQNFGFNSLVEGEADRNYGYNAIVNGNSSDSFGVFADVSNAVNNIAIYGTVPTSLGSDIAGFFDGDISTTAGFFAPSDRKLKENISNLENTIESILQLKPKSYTYIESDKINLSKGNQYGFIAQELEEIFPELTKNIKKPVFDENNNIVEYLEYKSVNYLGLIAILTASVQELSQEVERLKETNNSYVVYSDKFDAEEMKRLKKLAYKLEQNYPNPFQGKSIIEYSLPEYEENASIMVFNMTGKLLKEFKLREKSGTIEVSSDDFEPGIYLYSLISNNDEIITKKMIVK